MARTGANRSAIDLDTAKYLARVRKLTKEYGATEAGKRVGCDRSTAYKIAKGQRHKGSYTALDQLGLRYSDRLCRGCGKPCGIVCKSLLCIRCELIELHKQGVIAIGVEGKP